MKVSNKVVLLLLVSILAIRCDELIFVQEIFRHGARSPYSIYWDGPEQMSLGQEITPTGQHQHYLLGRQLRKEYIEERKFLSEEYNWKEIFVRSTDVNRTITSANSQLMGLYPKGLQLPEGLPAQFRLPPFEGVQDDSSLGQNALPFQMANIPVHIVSPINDQELLPYLFCPNYEYYAEQFQNAHAQLTDQFNQNFTQTFQQLSEVFNTNFTDFREIGGMYGLLNEIIVGNQFNGRPLPANLTQDLIDKVKFIDSFAWFYNDFGTEEGVKIFNTPVFNYMINNFEKKLNNTYTDLKWVMLSAHDANLAPIQRAFNFSSYECLLEKYYTNQTSYLNCENRPGFASSIILELYNNTSNSTEDAQYVKIRFNGKYMNLCEKKSDKCSYTEFKQRIQNYVVPDFQQACNAPIQESHATSTSFSFRGGDETKEEANPLLKYVILQSIVIVILSFALIMKNRKMEAKLGDSYRALNPITVEQN